MARVTMQQIASAAGVSKMTVSRALKNHPHVAPDVRRKIAALSEKLGYRTHPYISALMSSLAQTRDSIAAANLAVFHFETLEKTMAHDYYKGINERVRVLGYTAEPFHFQPSEMAGRRLKSILMARGIRGIILMPAPEGFTSIDFDFDGFAVAALGHTIVHPPLPRVAGDIYTGTFQAFGELARRGYRRIGLVNTEYVNRLGNFLYSAAISAYREHVAPRLHLVEHTLENPSFSKASLTAMQRWILSEKLDAVVCPIFGLPLYEILQKQGFSIPRKLAYLHLLDYPNPRVTCLGHMGTLMGNNAVDLIVAMINRNEFSPPPYPQIVGTPSRWHEGETAPDRHPPASAR